MRKFLVMALPVLILICFVSIMLSGDFLKKSFGENDNISESIQLITQDINSDNWESANEKTDNLSDAWRKIVKRIQFSSERNEINSFDTSIARLQGAIMARDKSASFMELNEAYEHWKGLGR